MTGEGQAPEGPGAMVEGQPPPPSGQSSRPAGPPSQPPSAAGPPSAFGPQPPAPGLLPPPGPLGTDVAVPAARGLLRPPRDRGALDIADRVVVKVAGRAASEVDGVQVPNVGGLRDLVGSGTPKVQAKVDGHAASVTVVVAIDYPLPVFDTAAEVRRRVMVRLGELAGMDRVEVRVEVNELTTLARGGHPRVV